MAQRNGPASTTKFAKKMDKRSGDKYNEFKAKADAKKAAAALVKAEVKEEKKVAAGERNTGAGFSRALGGALAPQAAAAKGAGCGEGGLVGLLLSKGFVAVALSQLAGGSCLACLQYSVGWGLLEIAPGYMPLPLVAIVVAPGAVAGANVLKEQLLSSGGCSRQTARRSVGGGALLLQGICLLSWQALPAASIGEVLSALSIQWRLAALVVELGAAGSIAVAANEAVLHVRYTRRL